MTNAHCVIGERTYVAGGHNHSPWVAEDNRRTLNLPVLSLLLNLLPLPSLQTKRSVKYCIRRRLDDYCDFLSVRSLAGAAQINPFLFDRPAEHQTATCCEETRFLRLAGRAAVYRRKQSDGRAGQFIRSVRRQIELRALDVVATARPGHVAAMTI